MLNATNCRTAKGADNRTICVGDLVEIRNFYTDEWLNRVLVVKHIHKQGNGSILHFDDPPLEQYPHNLSHPARDAKKYVP